MGGGTEWKGNLLGKASLSSLSGTLFPIPLQSSISQTHQALSFQSGGDDLEKSRLTRQGKQITTRTRGKRPSLSFLQAMNFVDFLAILPYIISSFVESLKDLNILGKAGKIMRLARVMRILRVFKLVRHFAG